VKDIRGIKKIAGSKTIEACSIRQWLPRPSERIDGCVLCLDNIIGRLRSSNCNSDTIDELPDWIVVEKQEYDLLKETIRQLYYCYKI